jgi:hypothetical protein
VSAVRFEPVLWTDERAVVLQRILEEDLHGRYARHLQPGPGRDAALSALAVDPDDVLATVLAVSDGTGPVAHAGLRSLNGSGKSSASWCSRANEARVSPAG